MQGKTKQEEKHAERAKVEKQSKLRKPKFNRKTNTDTGVAGRGENITEEHMTIDPLTGCGESHKI